MTRRKARLTVTVDANLVAAGQSAVRAGRADSLSGWVNAALADRDAQERRTRALADAVAAYEAQFGEITPMEAAAQERADQKAAVVLRGKRRRAPLRGGRRSRAA
jgi:glycerol dehydrogenase-like iron-containing ADH family enzyme